MIQELKSTIRETLNSFATGDLYDQAIGLFETLGYHPERKNRLENPTFQCFMESFPDSDRPFSADKAMAHEWQFVDILFQLTGSEIKKLLQHNEVQTEMDFGTEGVVGINKAIIESYLFFAISLTRPRYSRTELSAITREVNRLFLCRY